MFYWHFHLNHEADGLILRDFWVQQQHKLLWLMDKIVEMSSSFISSLHSDSFVFVSLLQWVWRVPPWASSPPPQRSCSRAVPHWCVWPAGASPQPGVWTGRWGAPAGPRGCPAAWRSWGRTAATAGAAPWASLQTSGGRRAQWAVRPVWVDRALSLKPWSLTAAQSRASATLLFPSLS